MRTEPKKTPKITAKVRHKQRLLEYLSDWENPFPTAKQELAKIIGIRLDTFYSHYSPAEINDILGEGLELRKKNAAVPRAEAYSALRRLAKEGSVQAAKEILDRTEGKVVDRIEHSGRGGRELFPVLSEQERLILENIGNGTKCITVN